MVGGLIAALIVIALVLVLLKVAVAGGILGLIVVEGDRPVGVVTEGDCAGVDRFTILERVMSRDLLTVPHTIDPEAAEVTADSGRLA